VLNIAEGASEYSRKEKMRFYRIARRSTAETHAALLLLKAVGALTERRIRAAARIADDVSRMLAGLLRPTAGIGNASAPTPAPASAPGNASASAPSSRSRRISP
jgi:rhamnose utilization protein RhaD (predicted bifunctional aldolase and dehydrogenase)